MPAMPIPLSGSAAIRPATKVPCPCCVDARRAADEALRVRDPARELGMARVDAGVDHRDPDAAASGGRRPGVVRAVLLEIPLPVA